MLVLFISLLAAISCSNDVKYIQISGYAQGGTYSVKAAIGLHQNPENIKTEIDSILAHVDRSVSGYNKASLLSAFNRGENIIPDDILLDIYKKSRQMWEITRGTLDVSSAPLFDVWGFGFTSDSLPSDLAVEDARKASGMDRLVESLEYASDGNGYVSSSSIVKDGGPSAELNFNAVAQGYSCDLIARYLYSIGVSNMLIDVGGEIFCDGLNPSGNNWTIGIDRPVDGNNTPGADMQGKFKTPGGPCGVVTSGNYRKFYVRDGRKYSHTIDPRTGRPAEHSLLSATVIAPDATLADGYATACMVMGLEEAREFVDGHPEIQACLIYDDNGVLRCWTSGGLSVEEF